MTNLALVFEACGNNNSKKPAKFWATGYFILLVSLFWDTKCSKCHSLLEHASCHPTWLLCISSLMFCVCILIMESVFFFCFFKKKYVHGMCWFNLSQLVLINLIVILFWLALSCFPKCVWPFIRFASLLPLCLFICLFSDLRSEHHTHHRTKQKKTYKTFLSIYA